MSDNRDILIAISIFSLVVIAAIFANLDHPFYQKITIANKSYENNPGGLLVVTATNGEMYYPDNWFIYTNLSVNETYDVKVGNGNRIRRIGLDSKDMHSGGFGWFFLLIYL
jgi:hypothetical protein